MDSAFFTTEIISQVSDGLVYSQRCRQNNRADMLEW